MGKFNFQKTPIDGLYVIQPAIHNDNRGHFLECYNHDDFFNNGLDMNFCQENESFSRKGVIRGLHFQKKHPQGKLVRIGFGEIFDVAVDLRRSSQTYKKWFGVRLSSENKKQLYIPEGFAHGFSVLSDTAVVIYKCSEYYYPDDEGGIIYNDSTLGIDWMISPDTALVLSAKDLALPSLEESSGY